MTKFEYLVVEIPTTGLLGYKVDFEKLNSQLNEAGKQGWQLATNFKPSSQNNTPKNAFIILQRELTH
jgi:hypothetical protein